MSQEVHKHYHINLLPQNEAAWFGIALTAFVISAFWALERSVIAKAEVEKAKYEAQGRAQIVQEKP